MALRLTAAARPSLQRLWERTHRTAEERAAEKDALPMRCNAAWFRATFLKADAPMALGADDDVWMYVRGFN